MKPEVSIGNPEAGMPPGFLNLILSTPGQQTWRSVSPG